MLGFSDSEIYLRRKKDIALGIVLDEFVVVFV